MFQVQVPDRDAASKLYDLRFQRDLDYEFWQEISVAGRPVDIMAPKDLVQQLMDDLDNLGLSYGVKISNLQETIDKSLAPANKTFGRSTKHNFSWDEYHTYDDMISYLTYLVETYPACQVEEIGETNEGRMMYVLKVCGSGECNSKPAIWLDGGIHAREWISPATLLFMARELIENPDNADLIEGLDWYFVPSHNPDGYEESRTNVCH